MKHCTSLILFGFIIALFSFLASCAALFDNDCLQQTGFDAILLITSDQREFSMIIDSTINPILSEIPFSVAFGLSVPLTYRELIELEGLHHVYKSCDGAYPCKDIVRNEHDFYQYLAKRYQRCKVYYEQLGQLKTVSLFYRAHNIVIS